MYKMNVGRYILIYFIAEMISLQGSFLKYQTHLSLNLPQNTRGITEIELVSIGPRRTGCVFCGKFQTLVDLNCLWLFFQYLVRKLCIFSEQLGKYGDDDKCLANIDLYVYLLLIYKVTSLVLKIYLFNHIYCLIVSTI